MFVLAVSGFSVLYLIFKTIFITCIHAIYNKISLHYLIYIFILNAF